jgi:hypothetical protein
MNDIQTDTDMDMDDDDEIIHYVDLDDMTTTNGNEDLFHHLEENVIQVRRENVLSKIKFSLFYLVTRGRTRRFITKIKSIINHHHSNTISNE